MAIVLVRHGETALNRARITQPPDVALSVEGQAQARALAERLSLMHFTSVLCSDLVRARMTAAPYLAASGLVAQYLPELREQDFGDILGTPYDELDVDIYDEHYEPPNGENAREFFTRVDRAWKLIVTEASTNEVLVITHGHFCRVLAKGHLTFEPASQRPTIFANTSVTIIDAERPHRVELANCTAHLQTKA